MKKAKVTTLTPGGAAEEIVGITDRLCAEHLDAEYGALCRKAITRLARKRPSPLSRGEPRTWAAGVIYAIGMVNFLTDPAQKPHMTTDRLSEACGVGKSTLSAKFRIIQDLLRLSGPMDPEYCKRDLLSKNPLAWMVKVNGFIVDARTLPAEMQEEARQRGLIPDLTQPT